MNILNKVTLKYLGKNKVRTLVTVIGIILSTAMFTAVTTSISSFQNYMVECVTETDGTWHAAAYDLSYEECAQFQEQEEITETLVLAQQGYLKISQCVKNGTEALESRNSEKPYLLFGTWQETDSDLIRIELTEGRMPETENEILVPKHLVTNGGVLLELGDTITGALGERSFQGEVLSARNMYYGFDTDEEGNPVADGESESFTVTGEAKTYTVVGFYERSQTCVESYDCPGYLVLTGAMESGAEQSASYQVYYRVKNITKIFDFMESQDYSYDYHSDLLRTYGTSRDSYQTIFWGLGIILAGIIMFGSVALIYNAFSISVNERVKQFGLLSSIGATKKQLKRSVLFEAVCVGGMGVPFGILAGVIGMAITFYCLSDSFASLAVADVELSVHVEPWAVLAAAGLAFITVMVSAWIPARKTLKISAIEAIRQNSEIKCSRKKVRTSKLVYRLFGLEGMLANKNFKRNKRKYRSTVFSLFVSIVLFVSASSFVTYLKSSVNNVVLVANYDYIYTLFEKEGSTVTASGLKEQMDELEEIERVSERWNIQKYLEVEKEALTQDYLDYAAQNWGSEEQADGLTEECTVNFVFLTDEDYRAYLAEQGLSGIGYFENKEALVFDGIRVAAADKYRTLYQIKQSTGTLKTTEVSYTYERQEQPDGSVEYVSRKVSGESRELAYRVLENDLPFGVGKYDITMVYPLSAATEIGISLETQPTYLYIKAAESGAYDKVAKLLFSNGLEESRLYDLAEGQTLERNMILILNVFSYGFIILISLIAAANVFNTISTGISLRSREFAMLESVGMTKKSFYKMLDYECLMYGVKSICYGVPVSVLITWAIYRVISNGYDMGFYMPVSSILIAVLSVFLVVFTTMFYSAAKVKRHSVVETLKNENV